MRITILAVSNCPNSPVVRERITAALDGRTVEVDLVEVSVEDGAEAARWGMAGSPTVLLDGIDPFPGAGASASMSCRLYRDADGRADGAPSVEALRRALADAIPVPTATDEACCEADSLDPIGRAGRGRHAPVERGLRAVHQAVLRHFVAEGAAPETAALEPIAAHVGRTAVDVLAELDREDFLTLDDAGRIRAAYPFSAVETRHRVQLADGGMVWAMCAVDALGISAMLGGQDVRISSSDPVNGEPVTVTFVAGAQLREPEDAVVFVGCREGDGPAATVCCDALNFFSGRASAEQWQREHPDVSGQVVGQDQAVQIAQQTFGPLLWDA